MSKLLELFNNRHQEGKMYQGSAVNAAHGVDRIREAGEGHPLQYVYPGAGGVSVKDDEALVGGTISHLRDTDRMSTFEGTDAGARFLQRQILLQRLNPWAQTRQYRTDNIGDHTDPTTHKQRHGTEISLSSVLSSVHELPFLGKVQAGIPGEFAIQLNSGTVQTETATKLISSSGPVHYRLNSKEGMLHTGSLSLLDIVFATVRKKVSNFINDLLEPLTRFVSDASARISGPEGSATYPRPETEFNYLEKIYDRNRGLADEYGNKHGHIYLALEKGEEGTYGHELNARRSARGGVVGLVSQFLPSFSDISLFRAVKRFTVDITSVIDRVVGGGSALKQSEFGPSDIALRYGINFSSHFESSAERSTLVDQIDTFVTGKKFHRTADHGARPISVDRYIEELSNYKGESNKMISIGWGAGTTPDNTTKTDLDENISVDSFMGATFDSTGTARKPYYKDFTQLQYVRGRRTIFKEDIKDEFDTDSIDVLISVRDGEEVRFRAFIDDITETVSPGYNESKYIGRYETFYTYQDVVRNVSFKLRLQSFSPDETDHIMKKMAYLTSLAYPESSDNYLTPQVAKLTIGKVYRKQPCILQALSHTIEQDTSWDINKQLPMSVVVTMDVRLLDKKLYTYNDMKTYQEFKLYLDSDYPMLDTGKSESDVDVEIGGVTTVDPETGEQDTEWSSWARYQELAASGRHESKPASWSRLQELAASGRHESKPASWSRLQELAARGRHRHPG